jgi:ribonuclease HII/SAM-dependent methyltransferase
MRHLVGVPLLLWIVVGPRSGCLTMQDLRSTSGRMKALPFRSRDPIDVERSLLSPNQRHPKSSSYQFVMGTDESGTGCIAGPIIVVSACLLQLQNYTPLAGVMDSKSLSAAECYAIYRHVRDHPDLYAYTTSYVACTDMNESTTGVSRLIWLAMAHTMETLIDKALWHRITPSETVDVASASTKRPVPIYSIVDGHRAPSDFCTKYAFPCRPYKHGDAMIYTVALASCIARHLHEDHMEILSKVYPLYLFQVHGGYPTAEHVLAIHQYGILDEVHRTSCAPIQKLLHNSRVDNPLTGKVPIGSSLNMLESSIPSILVDDSTRRAAATSIHRTTQRISPSVSGNLAYTSTKYVFSRKAFGTSLLYRSALLLLSSALPGQAMYLDRATGISFPDVGEIAAAVPRDWSMVENPLDNAQQLARLDATEDRLFYSQPRFVEHIDPPAVERLTQYIDGLLQEANARSCLDLCASWTSHISRAPSSLQRVVGLGMNDEELKANRVLTEYVVQDLNQNPRLPFADKSFDVVLCQLSIDYLIQPLQVCQEIGRVLTEGGRVYLFYSNRSFLSKAVALWTGQDDVDHTFSVACYLYFCQSPPIFTNICATDLSRRDRKGQVIGDPLYVVSAMKASW